MRCKNVLELKIGKVQENLILKNLVQREKLGDKVKELNNLLYVSSCVSMINT